MASTGSVTAWTWTAARKSSAVIKNRKAVMTFLFWASVYAGGLLVVWPLFALFWPRAAYNFEEYPSSAADDRSRDILWFAIGWPFVLPMFLAVAAVIVLSWDLPFSGGVKHGSHRDRRGEDSAGE